MESARLLIRRMEKGDEAAFVSGIADRALRIAYGFPPDMEDRMSSRIFERFSGLEGGYSLIEKTSGTVIGFQLASKSFLLRVRVISPAVTSSASLSK